MVGVTWRDDSENLASIIGQLTRDTVPTLWGQLQHWNPKTINLK